MLLDNLFIIHILKLSLSLPNIYNYLLLNTFSSAGIIECTRETFCGLLSSLYMRYIAYTHKKRVHNCMTGALIIIILFQLYSVKRVLNRVLNFLLIL